MHTFFDYSSKNDKLGSDTGNESLLTTKLL